MIIVWGSRLFGKCDVVPGLFHVATKFGHLWYLPLIPMGSCVVTSHSSDGWNGVPISLSFKSIMLAWARVFLLVMASGMTLWVVMVIGEGKKNESPVGPIINAVLFWGLLALTYSKFVCRASYSRACRLGREVGLNQIGMAEIEKIYGASTARGFEVQKPATSAAPAMAAPRPVQSASRTAAASTARPKPVDDDGGAIPLEPPARPIAKKRPGAGPIGLT